MPASGEPGAEAYGTMSLSAATACEETLSEGDPIGGGGPHVGASASPPFRPRPASGVRLSRHVWLCPLLVLFSALAAHADLIVAASEGYSITWNGNDGDYFDQAVPDNLASAVNGSTAISSGELGPQIGLQYHVTANINDGLYGNQYSWIGGNGDAAPWYAGVLFASPVLITSIAFGRDNGIEASILTDRSDGSYTLQYTSDGIQ